MEACASAHYRGREIGSPGHAVRLISPVYVKAHVKRQKNDAAGHEFRGGEDEGTASEGHAVPDTQSSVAPAHTVDQRSARLSGGIRRCCAHGAGP